MLVESGREFYFTTPHWNGYSAGARPDPDLKKLAKAELRDRVEEAWLKRAPKKLAKEWLGAKRSDALGRAELHAARRARRRRSSRGSRAARDPSSPSR